MLTCFFAADTFGPDGVSAWEPKYWERTTFGLDLLQAFEIPQNHQHILWKALDKTSGNLEMFGKSLEPFEAPHPGASRLLGSGCPPPASLTY
jgi:hypothetical protein